MAKVFLSSTLDNLREYRNAAFEVLRRIGHEPIGIRHCRPPMKTPLRRP